MLRVLEMAREAVHFVGVDLGFVKVAEWAKVLNSADTLLLVAEPRAPALEMLERFLKGMKSAGLDSNPFRIVINRSRQNDDSIQKSERALKQTFFARLPNDCPQVSDAVTLGIPLMSCSNNPLAGRFRDLAARLLMPNETIVTHLVPEPAAPSVSRRAR